MSVNSIIESINTILPLFLLKENSQSILSNSFIKTKSVFPNFEGYNDRPYVSLIDVKLLQN